MSQVWKQKMAPRVKTFAWRSLRRAIPTGPRSGRFSSHISSSCARCDIEEDDLHLLFLYNFARAAWFGQPWYIISYILVQNHDYVANIIMALINMNHRHVSISNTFTFLWCLWKARNDMLFLQERLSPPSTCDAPDLTVH